MTDLDLRTTNDVGALWQAFMAARRGRDRGRVRAIENRMRALAEKTRFAHLTDAELEERIAALDGNRAAEGMLAHSPGGNDGMDAGIADLMIMNQRIREQQHVGVEELRAALLAEQDRRALTATAG